MTSKTRSRLLEAGRKLFDEKGFEAVAVADLEAAAGLTPRAGGFYRHFRSKSDLLLKLVEDRIETPEELGLTSVFPLGDTRAELIYIGRAYDRLNPPGKATDGLWREALYRCADLIEVRTRGNKRLLEELTSWLSTKAAAQGMDQDQLDRLAMIVFGGWLFYLTKRAEASLPVQSYGEALLNDWADQWAAWLDTPAG